MNSTPGIALDEALSRLRIVPDYDSGTGAGPHVHTFRGGVGAHCTLPERRALIERYGVEEAGPNATRMGHGLVVMDTATGGPGTKEVNA